MELMVTETAIVTEGLQAKIVVKSPFLLRVHSVLCFFGGHRSGWVNSSWNGCSLVITRGR